MENVHKTQYLSFVSHSAATVFLVVGLTSANIHVCGSNSTHDDE